MKPAAAKSPSKAFELFGEIVSDVLKRAKVSRRTFYEQFTDKDECLHAAYDDAERRAWEMAARHAAALDRVAAVLQAGNRRDHELDGRAGGAMLDLPETTERTLVANVAALVGSYVNTSSRPTAKRHSAFRHRVFSEDFGSARHARVRNVQAAIMETIRESWTDQRLDDFAGHVDQRFDAVDRRFDSLERRMENGFKELREELRTQREENKVEFKAMRGEIVALHRLMVQFCGVFVAALLGLIATQL